MKINLPKAEEQEKRSPSMLYTASTMGSTHSNQGFSKSAMAGDIQFSLPGMFDPSRMGAGGSESYNIGGLDVMRMDEDDNVRVKVLEACRNIMKTHAVHSACCNVYTRYPLQGMRLECKDKDLEKFYTELFLEDLDYEQFFIDYGKTFWTTGEAHSLGKWSDELGLWVGEEIIDPSIVETERVPLSGQDIVYIRPTQEMKSLARESSAAGQEFRRRNPEWAEAMAKGERLYVSPDRMVSSYNREYPGDIHGTPIILRSWNSLRLEDRMYAAMQATADRLYAPLIMFTIGGTLPDGNAYIPPARALDAFRDNLDAALSSKFRAIITHDGVKSQEVIRGDRMNNFKQDIDMYDERVFMSWGLTSAILKPQSGNYATSSMEFQLASQLLATYQKMLVKVYEKRAAMVAEAHGHYDYEVKGNERVTVYEQREVWDDETQSFVVKKVPKLLFPKLKFDVINFRDQQKEREFRMALRKEGVPISDDDIAVGVDIDLESSSEKYYDEMVTKELNKARANQSIYRSAISQGLVVPPDTYTYMQKGVASFKDMKTLEKFRDEIPLSETDGDKVDENLQFSSDAKDDMSPAGRPASSDEAPM